MGGPRTILSAIQAQLVIQSAMPLGICILGLEQSNPDGPPDTLPVRTGGACLQ